MAAKQLSSADLRTGEAVCLVDRQGRIIGADAVASSWAATSAQEPSGLADIIGSALAAEAVKRIAAGSSEISFEATLRLGDLAGRTTRVSVRRLRGHHGLLALVTFQRDVQVAVIDELTGLPDRRAIGERIAQWRTAGGGSPPRFAVLFVDLDGFKQINDDHGHATGDQVLATIAGRLARCVRNEDLVARYGGDEFVVLLKDVGNADDAEPVITRLHQCTRQSLELGSLQLRVGATIGVAISDGSEQPLAALIAAADRDMYARKRRRPK